MIGRIILLFTLTVASFSAPALAFNCGANTPAFTGHNGWNNPVTGGMCGWNKTIVPDNGKPNNPYGQYFCTITATMNINPQKRPRGCYAILTYNEQASSPQGQNTCAYVGWANYPGPQYLDMRGTGFVDAGQCGASQACIDAKKQEKADMAAKNKADALLAKLQKAAQAASDAANKLQAKADKDTAAAKTLTDNAKTTAQKTAAAKATANAKAEEAKAKKDATAATTAQQTANNQQTKAQTKANNLQTAENNYKQNGCTN